MKQDALAKWLKFIIAGVGICGLLTYTVIMPRFAAYLVRQNSMLEKNVLHWLILIWISAIPCYAVLVLGWKIADNIRMDRSFSYENARYLKWVSYLSMADAVFVFQRRNARFRYKKPPEMRFAKSAKHRKILYRGVLLGVLVDEQHGGRNLRGLFLRNALKE
jgi:hypothetical protein